MRTTVSILSIGLAVLLLEACGGGDSQPTSTTNAAPPVATLALSPTTISLEPGQSMAITATARDAAGNILLSRSVSWSGSNDDVANVSTTGGVYAHNVGQVTIQATCEGMTATATVVVVPLSIARFAISPTSVALVAGTMQQFVASAFSVTDVPLSGRPVSWTSSAPAVAQVVNGLVTPVSPGTTTITATSEGKSATASVTVLRALALVQGDGQTSLILSKLPVSPSVKVVNAQGAAVAGATVSFSASGSGTVAQQAVTDGNGIATPGAWTLGVETGVQTLTASYHGETLDLHATATGTATFLTATSVASLYHSSCALLTTGRIACWGDDGIAFGVPASADPTRPYTLPSTPAFTAISGFLQICGLQLTGGAYCWGPGVSGMPTSPVRVNTPESWMYLRTGTNGACAIGVSGTAYCWGDNNRGQLGIGNRNFISNVVPVSGGLQFKAISMLYGHTCGVATDGRAYCWGDNWAGQLGTGDTVSHTLPVAVSTSLRFREIATSGAGSCAITTAGEIACWGNTGTMTPQLVSTPPGLDFTTITGDANSACALTSAGVAYCSGMFWFGVAVDGSSAPSYLGRDFRAVQTSLKFKQVSTSWDQTCAITVNSEVACWGANDKGTLGDGTRQNRIAPYRIVTGVVP